MRLRQVLRGVVLVGALLGVAEPARADEPEKGSAAPAREPTAAEKEKSRAAFRKGVAQLKSQDWAGARASFEEAWALVPHSSILLNLGIARLKTDDPVLAEQDLAKFLKEDNGAEPGELTAAREALVDAKNKIGTLKVILTPPASELKVDGKLATLKPPANGPNSGATADIRVKAGKHTLTTEAEGYAPDQRDVDVPAKGETDVTIALASTTGAKRDAAVVADGKGPSTRTILGWSLVGLGGVALIATGVFGLKAIGDASDYNDPKSKSFQHADVKSDGVAARTGADIAFLIALLAGTGAVVLLATNVPLPIRRSQPPFVFHW